RTAGRPVQLYVHIDRPVCVPLPDSPEYDRHDCRAVNSVGGKRALERALSQQLFATDLLARQSVVNHIPHSGRRRWSTNSIDPGMDLSRETSSAPHEPRLRADSGQEIETVTRCITMPERRSTTTWWRRQFSVPPVESRLASTRAKQLLPTIHEA